MALVEGVEEKDAADEVETKDEAGEDTQHESKKDCQDERVQAFELRHKIKFDKAFEEFVTSAQLGRELTAEERAMHKKKFLEAMLEDSGASSAAPAAQPKSEFKLSQIVPVVVVVGMQKYDPEALGYTRHVEIGYVVVQLLCFCVLYFIYDRINNMKQEEDGITIQIPEVKQMGQVVSPAKELTTKEYDKHMLKEAVKLPLGGFVILGGIYCKWGSLMPLVMQMLMTPMQLYEAPLTQIHLLGKVKQRPFGLLSAPEAEAPAVEEKKDK